MLLGEIELFVVMVLGFMVIVGILRDMMCFLLLGESSVVVRIMLFMLVFCSVLVRFFVVLVCLLRMSVWYLVWLRLLLIVCSSLV